MTIEYEHVQPLKQLEARLGDFAHICTIREIADAEAEYRLARVDQRYGHPLHPADLERPGDLALHEVRPKDFRLGRRSAKRIPKAPQQCPERLRIRPHIQRPLLYR